MKLPFFGKFSSGAVLGVDIGTSAIKVVEMTREGGRFKLLNYGIFELESQEKTMQANQKAGKLPDEDIIWGIKEVLKQAGINSKNVVASIPSFSTFATIISLPYLSEKELVKAIPYEAKKHIPIPLEEVVMDSSIVSVMNGSDSTKKTPPNVEVFLAAVPKAEVRRYRKIMSAAGLNLVTLDLENMALIRSLVGNDLSPTAIVNAGGRSAVILIVDSGYERTSHNYEVGSFEITKSIARSMGIGLSRAEELKRTVGLKSDDTQVISESMISLIDMMVFETKKTITNYEANKSSKIQKIVLVGGLTNMPNFVEYFRNKTNLEVVVGNPFARVAYPRELQGALTEIGPVLSIAIGLAMRGSV